MKKKEVIEAFLNKEEATNSTGSLTSTGSCLLSYNTCIAEWQKDGYILINESKYSTTTSQHQNLIKRAVQSNIYHYLIRNIPRDSSHILAKEERYEI